MGRFGTGWGTVGEVREESESLGEVWERLGDNWGGPKWVGDS